MDNFLTSVARKKNPKSSSEIFADVKIWLEINFFLSKKKPV